MTTLISGLIAQQQVGEELGHHNTMKARQLLFEILLPKQITGKLIEKYIRKAMRTGAWRSLAPQTKALLYIAKHFPIFKSKTITELLKQLLTQIEITATRGKAIYHGLLIYLRIKSINLYHQSLSTIKNFIEKLLSIGINYINNPFIS